VPPVPRFAPVLPAPEPKETPAVAEWPMFRGSAERSARGEGPLTSLRPLWSMSTTRSKQTLAWVEQGLREREQAGAGVVPAFHPITAGGKVIFRTNRGLSAVKADSAELLWENTSNSGLDGLLRDAASAREVTTWVTDHQRAGRAGIVIENSALGEISTDGTYVYAVDDLGVLPAAASLEIPNVPPPLAPPLPPAGDEFAHGEVGLGTRRRIRRPKGVSRGSLPRPAAAAGRAPLRSLPEGGRTPPRLHRPAG
jgi:hypothetical protein